MESEHDTREAVEELSASKKLSATYEQETGFFQHGIYSFSITKQTRKKEHTPNPLDRGQSLQESQVTHKMSLPVSI